MGVTSTHRISGGLDAAARARDVAMKVLGQRVRADPRLAEDVRLLVSELATNSLLHGGVREDEEFILAIETNDVIRVEVIDRGAGFEPKTEPRPAELGGYGLKLVERIADSWGVVRGRGTTRVWFELQTRSYGSA